jgi:SAM-dependent methyltransferase
MDKKYAEYLINKIRTDYNLISDQFSSTRKYLSKDIEDLGQYTMPGDKVLDLGCGNGRLRQYFKEKRIDYFGLDFSEELIKLAKENYPKAKFQTGSAMNLPYPNNYFDKIYSIAVLHHIPSAEFRLEFMREAIRALKPKGLLILRVWNFWQRKEIWLIVRYSLLKIFGFSKMDFKDIFDPWKDSKGNVLALNYYHCFTRKELRKLAEKSGFKIKKIWKEGRGIAKNIYLVAEK